MNDEMILKIEKCLEKLKHKSIKVNQDERNEVYISLNLNQVYQIEIGENKIILFLDNDTEINISI